MIDKDLDTCPLDEYPAIVREALNMLRDPATLWWKREDAKRTLEIASLQALPAVHLYLDEIFELHEPIDRATPHYPWRESGLLHFDFLKQVILDDSKSIELRKSAWIKMVETRHPDALRFAEKVAHDLGLSCDIYLESCGYQKQGELYKPLYPEQPFYLQFPEGYIHKNIPLELEQRQPPYDPFRHPTWHLPPTIETPMRFGGTCDSECAVCGGKLHHLITLNPIPENLHITGLSSLTLAVCASCLGWNWEIYKYLFYEHDADGHPRSIGYNGQRIAPEFPIYPIQVTTVRLAAGGARWRWQDGSTSGNQNRLGGFPYWIQDYDYPLCINCQRPMHFLLQLDSGLPTEDGTELQWGGWGMGYGMWCYECHISAYLLQWS
jgi:hypothetical protein